MGVTIEGSNNPKSELAVTQRGQAFTVGVVETEQQNAASDGLAFNINTDIITLTNDAETPIFYFKNVNESNQLKISRIFKSILQSTGGAGGSVAANIYKNITGGTILSSTELTIENFNFGSAFELNAEARIGGTGVTWTGTKTNINFLFPTDNIRVLTAFDHIIIQRGVSFLLTITPPAGNTSLDVLAGCNIFRQEIEILGSF
jgi:hypothetical protein